MKTVISFTEGCSGNFLAALISNSDIKSFKRIDTASNLKNANFIMLPFMETVQGFDVIATHESNSKIINNHVKPARIIRIEPVTGIFTAIYNVFDKKLIDEDQKDIMQKWPAEPGYCYDMTFEHMKDYYHVFSQSKHRPGQMLFDFGWLYQHNQLTEFLQSIGVDANLDLVDRYMSTQMPLLLSLPLSASMADIVQLIPEEYFVRSPWFACYCIFCFEHNNKLQEYQRMWSIDTLPVLSAEGLIALSTQYN
jgi:hypothetical protein